MRVRDSLHLCLLLLIVLSPALRCIAVSSAAASVDSSGQRPSTIKDNTNSIRKAEANKESKRTPHREVFVKTVESSLFQLFGFQKRPRIKREDVVIPDAMMQLYKEQTGMELNTMDLNLPGRHARSANTARSFTHIETSADAKFPLNRLRLLFDLKEIPVKEKLTAAELRLSRAPVITKGKRRKQQILVHDVVRPGLRGSRDPIFRLIDTKEVDIRDDNDIVLDVLPAAQRWLEFPKNNYGLLVEVLNMDGSVADKEHIRLRRSVDASAANNHANTRKRDKVWLRNQPLLFTYSDDGQARSRAKRVPPKKHRRKDGKETCRRHKLYVDFEEVGWNDWIVAPPGYDAYYCDGDCPFPLADHLNSTNHAIVQTLMNSVNPSTAPKACCVPTDLSTISMLYLDEENRITLKTYQDMVVEGCGCR